MTTRTVHAEVAFVDIVLAVAVDALLAHVAIFACQMTLLAWHRNVQPDQWKVREVMVERHMSAPAFRRVAVIAAGAQGSQMHIAGAMAVYALHAEFLCSHRAVWQTWQPTLACLPTSGHFVSRA